MTPDYLDLLLDRATGSVPLAEPRINPAAIGPPIAPQWGEIAEEVVRPYITPSNIPPLGTSDAPSMSQGIRDMGQINREPQPLEIFPRETAVLLDETLREASHPAASQPVIIAAREERKERSYNEAPEKPAGTLSAPDVKAQHAVAKPDHIVERMIPTQRWFPEVAPPDSGHPPYQPLTTALPERQAPQPAPISIRIDRIEVRAGGPAPRITSAPKQHSPAPLGLDEYLKRKNRGAQ